MPGGGFRPLTDAGRDMIIDKAFAVLEKIGIVGAPDWLRDRLNARGGGNRPDGRVLFARGRVEEALGRTAHNIAPRAIGTIEACRSAAVSSTSAPAARPSRCSTAKPGPTGTRVSRISIP